jgi:hypothetical protein
VTKEENVCDVYQDMIGKLERERDEALNALDFMRNESKAHEKRARDAQEQLVAAVHVARPTLGESLLDAVRRIVKQRDDHHEALRDTARARDELRKALFDVARMVNADEGEEVTGAVKRLVAERDRIHRAHTEQSAALHDASATIVQLRETVEGQRDDLTALRAAKPKPLTVADVERIVDAKLGNDKTTRRADVGPWVPLRSGGRGRYYMIQALGGPYLAALSGEHDGWLTFDKHGSTIASGRDNGAEGERMADAVLRAMGVTLRG